MAQDAVNPNALAAPATGFGQTVSFAFDANGKPPQVQPITSRGPQVGASGVSGYKPTSTKVDTSMVTADPTALVLMKVGDGLLNKHLDEARTEQFVTGMQRAMAGEAIQEVKDSVPWYAKAFGDTPVIEGARAYTAQDTVNKAITAQVSNIKAIEGLDPNAASKHFNDVVKSTLTGDKATDAIVMKQMTEQLPALMKAQAKAHYAFGQRKLSQTQMASLTSGAQRLQENGELYANDQINDKDMETMAKQFVASALPIAGQDEESYQKTLTSAMADLANKGQFHALEALKKSGVMQALTPEQATRADNAIMVAATKARDNYAFKFSKTIAEIKSDAAHPVAGMAPAMLSDRIDKASAAFQKLTGSPVGLFSSDQKADMLAGTFNAFKAEETRALRRQEVLSDKASTEGEKASAAAEADATLQGFVAAGDITKAQYLPGTSNEKIDLAVYGMAKKDPASAVSYLMTAYAKSNGYVNKLVQADLTAGLGLAAGVFERDPTSPPPQAFFEGVTQYRALQQKGGSAFANAYFGDHAKAMAYASYMLKDKVVDNPLAPDIYQKAMSAKNWKGESLDKKEQEAIVKEVTSSGKSWIHKATLGFAGTALRPEAVRFLAEDVKEGVAQWRMAGMSTEEATAFAINDALGADGKGSARAEIIGGYYVARNPAASTTKIADIMQGGNGAPFTAVPEEMRGKIFERFLMDEAKLPPNHGTTKIHRLPDVAGTPRFVVNGMDKDQVPFVREFTGTQLQQYAAERTKWERKGPAFTRETTGEEAAAYNEDMKRREATPYQPIRLVYGPEITYKPAEGQPSPYADAAAWAAYRQKQRKGATTK